MSEHPQAIHITAPGFIAVPQLRQYEFPGNSYCRNCGTAVSPGAAVCMTCGHALGNASVAGTGAKSKMAAGLLGIFLGSWGIHNFYLGYTTKAIIQIILTVCSCGIGGIWGFIEGILILCGNINTDANGNPLGE